MARFLFTVWPFSGHIHPNIAIAHALRDGGHDVAFYTGMGALATVRREGLALFPFQRIDEGALHRILYSQHRAVSLWRRARHHVKVLRAWLLDTLPGQVADQTEVIEAWRPDVVVSDVTMWGAPLVLHEKCCIPVAISSFVPGCMIPGPDAPPWGLGLSRPRGWLGHLRNELIGLATDLLATEFRHTANVLRQRYGLPPLTVPVQEFLGQMPLYLVPSVPEFDYQRRDLPPSVRYVGALVWNKPRDEPPPSWLEVLPRDRPWVHVTEGTMHSPEPLVLRAAVRGLADLPMQVIMTTGRDRDPSKLGLGPIASNIRVERWVAHVDLLPRTDVMVTTGGGGTVLAGLQAGVPMVVVPTQWEKPDNAQRVVEVGVGLRLAPRHCTPKRLRAAVEHVLSDGTFRDHARRMADIFAQYGGPREAARLIEGLLPGG